MASRSSGVSEAARVSARPESGVWWTRATRSPPTKTSVVTCPASGPVDVLPAASAHSSSPTAKSRVSDSSPRVRRRLSWGAVPDARAAANRRRCPRATKVRTSCSAAPYPASRAATCWASGTVPRTSDHPVSDHSATATRPASGSRYALRRRPATSPTTTNAPPASANAEAVDRGRSRTVGRSRHARQSGSRNGS